MKTNGFGHKKERQIGKLHCQVSLRQKWHLQFAFNDLQGCGGRKFSKGKNNF